MKLRIGTSEEGGTFDTQGAALAAVLGSDGHFDRVELARAFQASIDNAHALDEDRIDIGFMASNWIGRARAGYAPFDRPIDLRMVSPANAGPLFFIALAGSGIGRISDLPGKRVCLGPENSGMTQHVHTILGVLGISMDQIEPVYLGFADGAEALAAGRVDVQFQCPIPNAVMTGLSERAEIRVLEMGDDNLARLLAAVPFYRRTTMRAGAFRGLDADTSQIAVVNVIAAHARADDDAVRAVAATMLGRADALAAANPLFAGLGELFLPLKSDGAAALEFGGVPLHPGALAAYRAAGYLTP